MADGKIFIDSLREPDGGLTQPAIKKIIPYGDDFLFVNRITKLSARDAEAEYYINPNLRFLRSHFVNFSLMPGVLISEGFAQAGTVLIRYNLSEPEGKDILVCRVEAARFKLPAFPGDTLTYKINLKNLGSRAARLAGEVSKDSCEIASFSIVLSIVDRKQFQLTQQS